MAGTTTDVTPTRPPRTEAQIENDLFHAKRRLAANLDELVTQAHPKAVAHQVKEEARAFAQTEFEQVKEQVKDEYGWRVDRFVIVGGAVLGVVTFLLIVRALTKRAHES